MQEVSEDVGTIMVKLDKVRDWREGQGKGLTEFRVDDASHLSMDGAAREGLLQRLMGGGGVCSNREDAT